MERHLPGMEPRMTISDAFDAQSAVSLLNDDVIRACESLPRGKFDLLVTSPPYNIGKSYEQQTSLAAYLEWQTSVIRSLVPLMSAKGSICWQVGNFVDDGEVFPLDVYFYPIFKELGLRLRNRVVWHFDHGLHASKRFSGRYETLLWFTVGDSYQFHLDSVRVPSKYPGKRHFKGDRRGEPSGNPLGKNPSDFWSTLASDWDSAVWEIPNVKSNHCEKTNHPCQFPVELVERCVLAMTTEGDWVLDPFSGVGTSLVAAVRHGRHAVGIEKDPDYCQTAKSRLIASAAGELKVRPLGKPVHKPTGREKVAQRPLQWDESDTP